MKIKHLAAYMKCAEAFAECSSAERLKVGSVIVKNNRIISCGYNAQPEHINKPCEEKVYADGAGAWIDDIHFEYSHRDDKGLYKLITSSTVRHSEKNALLGLMKSNETSVGAALVCTHACCKSCSVDIVDAGIKEFYYKHDYRSDDGIKYLKENNVVVYKLDAEND